MIGIKNIDGLDKIWAKYGSFNDLKGNFLSQTELATSVNWTSKLSPPRNQGKCGGCWAFTTVAVVEAAYAISNPNLPRRILSEQ
jgi:C1A family cysteine protease